MAQQRPITVLSREVIGKIAAGEVVERPAAAVKELVENSIDAGATAITIEIRDGGITYFRVTDNGSGIAAGSIRMAFERHATSKITQAEDLNRIQTLGFRGEALASIAAVSQVTCTTRVRQEDHGVTVVNHGGQIMDAKEAACPEGTTFIVKNLFYNTPVRLKFLKNPAYEAGLVSDLVMRMILSNPGVSFRFISQGKTVYHSAGDGDMASAVFSIYGKQLLTSMRRIEGNAGGIVLSGYVGIGDSARGNRNHQSFYINGRYMKNPILSQALETACKERVTVGHFPICVLHLTIPYEQVDVNVHPNKLEVRFQNERLVFDSMVAMIADKLREDTPFKQIPPMELSPESAAESDYSATIIKETDKIPNSDIESQKQTKAGNASASPDDAYQGPLKVPEASPLWHISKGTTPVLREVAGYMPPYRSNQTDEAEGIRSSKETLASTAISQKDVPIAPKLTENPPVVEEITLAPKPERPPLRMIGVVFNTFILLEFGDQLLLIDQHAVHERLLYDKMMKAYDQQTATQALLVPQAVNLTYRELETYQENAQALHEAGFEVEPFGDQAVQLRGVPMILGAPQAKAFFVDILDQLDGLRSLKTIEKRRDAILQMACKKAVKGGERLTQMELEELVFKMDNKGVTPTCPHGRPLVVAISRTELEKRFKRIQ